MSILFYSWKDDPRGNLFLDFIRVVDFIRPRFFLMENVKGLLSSKVSNDDTSVFQIILNKFTKLGYKTIFGILDAVNYGVPQFRERFILLGSRDGEDIFFPMPTHFHFHQNKDYRWVTLRTAIADLENNNSDCVSFSDERMKYLKYVPEGGNWRNLPKRLIKDAMGGAYLSGGGKVGFYRRLNYDEPSPTLVTSPVQKASMLCHPTQNRPLSINEYKKIQQFPDNWIFIGTVTEKYKQIGNAVPIGLAKAIGQTIISIADGTNIVKTKRFRGTSIHNKIMKALLRD